MRRAPFPNRALLGVLCLIIPAADGCRGTPPPARSGAADTARASSPAAIPSPLALVTSAFRDGGPIPVRYTCDGDNVSPPLAWSGVPPATRSLALLCDDPDAPRARPWVHWVLFDLPPDRQELPEALPPAPVLPDGSRQGTTDFGRPGYGGPCPPRGGPHRYIFQLYALDTKLTLDSTATMEEVVAAMAGHMLAQGRLTGTYQRP